MSDAYDVQLEFKERLNYTEYIQTSITAINIVLTNEKSSYSKVKLMILNLFHDIPNTWYDEDFERDIENVVTIKEIPNIVRNAGVPLSKEYMKKNRIPLIKTVTDVNFFKLKSAIINMMDRRNMLVRKDKIEQSTGKNLEFESLDDLIESRADKENEETEN